MSAALIAARQAELMRLVDAYVGAEISVYAWSDAEDEPCPSAGPQREALQEALRAALAAAPEQAEPVAHAHVYSDTNSFNDSETLMRVRVVFADPFWKDRQKDGATVPLYAASPAITSDVRQALNVALGALQECSPCAAADCQATQRDWLDGAITGIQKVLAQAPAAPIAQPLTLTNAARDVLAERRRQIEAEGWTPEHDDAEHLPGELALAACCYCVADEDEAPPAVWPWDTSWWKPKDRRRNMVRAAALLLAEIERLDRAAGIGAQEQPR